MCGYSSGRRTLSAELKMNSEMLNHRKRLERTGNENSPSNRKLRTAAYLIAKAICEALKGCHAVRLDLPGAWAFHQGEDYQILTASVNCAPYALTFYDSRWELGAPWRNVDLFTARIFAIGIAEGRLSKVAKEVMVQRGNSACVAFKKAIALA